MLTRDSLRSNKVYMYVDPEFWTAAKYHSTICPLHTSHCGKEEYILLLDHFMKTCQKQSSTIYMLLGSTIIDCLNQKGQKEYALFWIISSRCARKNRPIYTLCWGQLEYVLFFGSFH